MLESRSMTRSLAGSPSGWSSYSDNCANNQQMHFHSHQSTLCWAIMRLALAFRSGFQTLWINHFEQSHLSHCWPNMIVWRQNTGCYNTYSKMRRAFYLERDASLEFSFSCSFLCCSNCFRHRYTSYQPLMELTDIHFS